MKPSLVLTLAVVLIALAGLGWLVFSYALPRRLAPAGGIPFERMIEGVPHVAQADERWGKEPLALTTGTLAAEGCAVASLAMVLGAWGGACDPGELNRWLIANEGFTERGWLKWEAVNRLGSGEVRVAYEGDPSYALLDWNVWRGTPSIVRVRYANGITHFVVVVGKRGRDYLVLDPALREQAHPYALREFGSPIEALRFYRRAEAATTR